MIDSALRQKAIGEIASFMARQHGLAEHDREFGEQMLDIAIAQATKSLREFNYSNVGGLLARSALLRAGVSEATTAQIVVELGGSG